MATDDARISDAEREQYVELLGRAVGAGRLTVDEFDERAAHVYRATTVAEARTVLADLPAEEPVPVPPARTARRPLLRRPPLHQRIEWRAWAAVGVINLVVWALVSLGTTSLVYPWPLWVIGPWGLVLLGRTVLGIEGTGCAQRTRAHRDAARAHRERVVAMRDAHLHRALAHRRHEFAHQPR